MPTRARPAVYVPGNVDPCASAGAGSARAGSCPESFDLAFDECVAETHMIMNDNVDKAAGAVDVAFRLDYFPTGADRERNQELWVCRRSNSTATDTATD